jgi:glycosyltransferase involved in cell wall biosynthesis
MDTTIQHAGRLRLAVVTSFPMDAARPHGGVEAVSVNLVPALTRFEDLEVHVVTTDPGCTAASVTQWEGATIHRLPWQGHRVLTHATRSGRQAMQAYLERLQPDVIHAHDFYGMMTQGLAIPRVFTIHGFIHADTLQAGERFSRLRARLWRRAEHACWANQPHIISISPYVRESLRGIAQGVIHDIDNPIDRRCFEVERRERQGTIFSAALICPRKNTIGLLQAFASLLKEAPEARLRLAGAFVDPEYEVRVRWFLEQAELEERVALLGSIGADRVREELARASVFALVSLEEGAPMGVAEAMAAGVPVVTSNRCGMPYMVRDGESGFLVDADDPRDAADRMRQMLADDDLRSRMGCVGRRIAEDRFHPDRVATRTREVYLRAVREKGLAHAAH